MKLENVVPWGRLKAGYSGMFSLSPEDLNGRILDCAGGPASFNAEASADGARVVSCDPLYGFTAGEIRERIAATCETMISNARAAREEFVWGDIGSPDRLGEVRMAAMRRFLEDFPRGLEEGRYRAGELPSLPFGDGEFDLASAPTSCSPIRIGSRRASTSALSRRCAASPGRLACSVTQKLWRTVSIRGSRHGRAEGQRIPGRDPTGPLRVSTRRKQAHVCHPDWE